LKKNKNKHHHHRNHRSTKSDTDLINDVTHVDTTKTESLSLSTTPYYNDPLSLLQQEQQQNSNTGSIGAGAGIVGSGGGGSGGEHRRQITMQSL